MKVLENGTRIAVKLWAASHSFPEKFVQKFVQSVPRVKLLILPPRGASPKATKHMLPQGHDLSICSGEPGDEEEGAGTSGPEFAASPNRRHGNRIRTSRLAGFAV